jgi:serine/threonine-protein kinase RsbW
VTTISLKNRIEELQRLEGFLREFFDDNQIPDQELNSVHLILEELVTNAVFHGYDDDREHEILIRLALEGEDLRIEVEDDGRAFDPLKVPAAEIAPTLEEQQIGGMGILLVKSLASEIRYQRIDGKNHLTLLKARIRP